jgi:ParB family transcriptional regulator, chromosome partitioning protein
MAKPALGRGLGALMGGKNPVGKAPLAAATPAHPAPTPEFSGERVLRVPLGRVQPCPFQPRKSFSPESLRELADSIQEQGIVQPLIVRDHQGSYELIAGERRWRAAKLLNLSEVPVIVRQADDRTVLELALIENLQRENLNPIEEAQGYGRLISDFDLTQEEAALKVGRSRAVVANSLRLLKLPPEIQGHVKEGRISVGHAKVILGLEGEARQRSAADRVIKGGLNVRQTEELVSRMQARAGIGPGAAPEGVVAPDAHVASLENRLRERLGTKIHLRYSKGKGALEIAFFSDDELERILQLLGVSPE